MHRIEAGLDQHPRQAPGQTGPVGQHPQPHRADHAHHTGTIRGHPQVLRPSGKLTHAESASSFGIVVDVAITIFPYAAGTLAYPDLTTPSQDHTPVNIQITRQSGKRKYVQARYVHNDRLADALGRQAFAALRGSPGARAYYDQLRARGTGHQAALRQLGNRLVGILHGCLKTGTHYDEDAAWAHHQQDQQAAA